MFSAARVRAVRFIVPADAKYVSFVRKSVRCIAELMLFGAEEVDDIELAASEAAANAVVHGRPDSGKGTITVECWVDGNTLEVYVEDEGSGADIPNVCILPPMQQEHGRGYFLMSRLMDSIRMTCTGKGLLIVMKKTRRPNNRNMARAG